MKTFPHAVLAGITLSWVLAASLASDFVPDVDLVYIVNTTQGSERIPPEGTNVLVEVHGTRNSSGSFGKVLGLDNGTFLVTATSKSIPNFQCLYSDTTCEWTKSGSWLTEAISSIDYENLSYRLPDYVSCDYNNGGCQVYCSVTISGLRCSCPPGYKLNPSDNRQCLPGEPSFHILSSTSGAISSPSYPSTYSNNLNITWLIVGKKNTVIQLNIIEIITESGYDFLKVYADDTQSNNTVYGKWSGTYGNIQRKSLSNILWVNFKTDDSNRANGFSGTYSTVRVQDSKAKMLKMTSSIGTMKLPLSVVSNDLCVSLVYRQGTLDRNPIVNVEHQSSMITLLPLMWMEQVNGWIMGYYMSISPLNVIDKPKYLIINWEGQNTKVFNIAECKPQGEKVYLLGHRRWTEAEFPLLKSGDIVDKLRCLNGGIFHTSSKVCVCPPGFTGNKCEEACGSNRFGVECESVCSWVGRGCRNMIFCNSLSVCTCATGYAGVSCNNECGENYYGPNCNIMCGKCKNGTCDMFTGECDGGCLDGFYPPFCHEHYITTRVAPRAFSVGFFNMSFTVDLNNTQGAGTPHLYVIQYKDKDADDWTTMLPQEIPTQTTITDHLSGLNAGTSYVLRIVLIIGSGNSYQGPLSPIEQFKTLCLVPNSKDYEIENGNITSTSFNVQWKYSVKSDLWCPISSYEVILHDRWRKYYKNVPAQESLQTTWGDLWPGHLYEVTICAKTLHGNPPCSAPFNTTTIGSAPGRVKSLKVDSTSARYIHVTWNRPLFTGGIIKGYKIQYECIRYIACHGTCSHSKGTIDTSSTTTRIGGLLPYSQYRIRVAAYSAGQGSYSEVFAMTHPTHPDNAPLASEKPMVSVSNSSALIQWRPPHCLGLNGNFKEYFYKLSLVSERSLSSFEGTTTNTTTTINNLKAKTDYEVFVYTVNVRGWNPEYKLIIPFSTSATVPDAVTDLEVYKKGRRMLGLRWGKPTKLYGVLKSFTITYHQKDVDQAFNATIPPTPCLSWPNFYCYTINSYLKPDKEYIINVKARNHEINEDGIGSSVTAQCREGAPEAPAFLRVLSSNDTSFEMEWGVPSKFNGELRSFLVNVEHIDAIDEKDCCEYFPVQELPFREENKQYSLQVDGLVPASTYIASVSAKTIILGPSLNTTFNTAPLPLTSLQPPQITGDKTVTVNKIPFTIHPRLKSKYLLLMLHENITSNIWNEDLATKMTRAINQTFYIISEFDLNEHTRQHIMTIGTGREDQNGTIGVLKDPKMTPGFHQLGLAVLLSHGDATSVSFAEGKVFNVGEG